MPVDWRERQHLQGPSHEGARHTSVSRRFVVSE